MKTININNKIVKMDDSSYEDVYLKHSWHFERGYLRRKISTGGYVRFHREILGLKKGDGRVVDHINRDRGDNRLENLRFVSLKENALNRNHNKYAGVSKNGKGWKAQVDFQGERYHLGTWTDKEEARINAENFRKIVCGEFYPSSLSKLYH